MGKSDHKQGENIPPEVLELLNGKTREVHEMMSDFMIDNELHPVYGMTFLMTIITQCARIYKMILEQDTDGGPIRAQASTEVCLDLVKVLIK